MKFNEKLIELRKQYGLSQEALGYELNVTRQTISKWELGVSTPEMDKLAELSKYFNISLDVLINDSINLNNPSSNTTSSNQPINPEFVGISSDYIPEDVKTKTYVSQPKKRTVVSYTLLMCLPFIIFAVIGISRFSNFKKENESLMNKHRESFESTAEISKFNSTLLSNHGLQDASSIQNIIEDILKKPSIVKEISVVYNDTEAKTEEEFLALHQTFENVDDVYAENYMVSFEYASEGYINKVIVKDLANNLQNLMNNSSSKQENNTPSTNSDSRELSHEVSIFNMQLKMQEGETNAFFIKTMFDNIINKPEEVKEIVVVYNDIKADSKKEWLQLQKDFDNAAHSNNYVVSFEYADEGYINKVIIKDK